MLRATKFASSASTVRPLVGPTLLPDGYRPCGTDVSSTYEDAEGEVLPAGAVYCGGDGGETPSRRRDA